MRPFSLRRFVALVCLLAGLTATAPVRAEGWQAVVIGQPGLGADTAFADAFHAADALSRGRDAMLLRDVTPGEVTRALSAVTDGDGVILYVAAPMIEQGGAVRLRDGVMPFDELLGQARQAGATRLALLVENCANRGGPAQPIAAPAPPDGAQLFLAASAAPGSACPATEARLTARLRAASGTETLQEAVAGLWTRSTLAEPVPMTGTNAPAPAPASTATPVVSVVSNDVVALSPVVTPVRNTPAIEPIAPVSAAASGQPQPGEAVLVFTPPPTSQIAAIPRAAGLPEPSIIVGIIEGVTNAAFDRAEDPGALDASEIAYDNLDARRGLQAQDPELFANLVNAGAFDPPQDQMARALQTELARMGCYTAGIDGIWGNGSRGSVTRYFDERDGVEPVSLEPVAELFRQIILADDIECAAPAVAARPAASSPSAGTARSSGTAARQTAPQRSAPAPAPRPAPANNTRRIQTGTALGIFR